MTTWTRKGTHLIHTLSSGDTLEIYPGLSGMNAIHRRSNGKNMEWGPYKDEAEAKLWLEDIAEGLEQAYKRRSAE